MYQKFNATIDVYSFIIVALTAVVSSPLAKRTGKYYSR
jgi:hypothetical protein